MGDVLAMYIDLFGERFAVRQNGEVPQRAEINIIGSGDTHKLLFKPFQ